MYSQDKKSSKNRVKSEPSLNSAALTKGHDLSPSQFKNNPDVKSIAKSQAAVQRTIRRSGDDNWASSATGELNYPTRQAASDADIAAGGNGEEALQETASDLGLMSEFTNHVIKMAPDTTDTSAAEHYLEEARDLGRAAQETISGRSDEPLNPRMSIVWDLLGLFSSRIEESTSAHDNSLEVMIGRANDHQQATNPLARNPPPESDDESDY
jgi:hypothetical protein